MPLPTSRSFKDEHRRRDAVEVNYPLDALVGAVTSDIVIRRQACYVFPHTRRRQWENIRRVDGRCRLRRAYLQHIEGLAEVRGRIGLELLPDRPGDNLRRKTETRHPTRILKEAVGHFSRRPALKVRPNSTRRRDHCQDRPVPKYLMVWIEPARRIGSPSRFVES